jgi:hypothetical protein
MPSMRILLATVPEEYAAEKLVEYVANAHPTCTQETLHATIEPTEEGMFRV